MLRPGAGPADVFRADRHQHADLCGDDIEPLGPALAHPLHLAAAAGTKDAVRLDHPLDARQMRRQVALVSVRRRGRCLPGPEGLFGRFARGGQHSRGAFQILERQVTLVGVELLGLRAEAVAPHLGQQPLQPGMGLLDLGQTGLRRGPRGVRLGQPPLEIRHAGRAGPARCHAARLRHTALPGLPKLPPESSCRGYPANRGRCRRSARTARQSTPSKSAAACADDSRITPPAGFGQ